MQQQNTSSGALHRFQGSGPGQDQLILQKNPDLIPLVYSGGTLSMPSTTSHKLRPISAQVLKPH